MIARLFRITRPDGIGLGADMGAGPAILLRELVFFRADLRRADWFGRGAPAPRAAGPAEARFRWLSAAEWHARSDDMETLPATATQRYGEGAGCLIGTIADRIVYHLWVSESGADVPWIFDKIEPPDGHLLVFDVWVHPDHRGGNLHWLGAAEACDEAVRRRRPIVFAGVETHEFPIFAAKYASLGLVVIEPCFSLVGLRFFSAAVHWRRSVDPRLRRITEDLAARYAMLCGTPAEEALNA